MISSRHPWDRCKSSRSWMKHDLDSARYILYMIGYLIKRIHEVNIQETDLGLDSSRQVRSA